MNNPKVTPREKDDVVIEEEGGVFERKIEHIPSSAQGKRRQDDYHSVDSQNKYRQHSDGSRFATTATQPDALSVPFWKHINRGQITFETREVGCFSLLNRADDKECFDDKRYLRGKSLFFFSFFIHAFVRFSVQISTSDIERQFRFENWRKGFCY